MPIQHSKSLEPTKSIRTKHFHSKQIVTNCVTNQYKLNYKFNQNLQSLGHISTNLAFRSRSSGACHLIGFTTQIILKYKHRIIQLNIVLCFPTKKLPNLFNVATFFDKYQPSCENCVTTTFVLGSTSNIVS